MDNYTPDSMMDYAVCDTCGELLPPEATFCPNCGSRRITRSDSDQTELPYQYDFLHDSDEGLLHTAPRMPPFHDDSYDTYEEQPSKNNRREPYYPDQQYEDEDYDYYTYETLPMAGTLAAVGFLAVVLLVACIGLFTSFFPKGESSGTSASVTHQTSSETPATSSETSSEKTEVHMLPEDVRSDSYETFAAENHIFKAVMASSYINPKVTRGSTDLAFDGNPETCWQDGVKGYGVGEWLLSYNPDGSAVKVSEVTVYNGYQSQKFNKNNKDMFLVNSRVSEFTVEFDDGSSESFTLKDQKDSQTFTFSERNSCYVRFTVKGVYKGTKYKDTCIGEIIYQ